MRPILLVCSLMLVVSLISTAQHKPTFPNPPESLDHSAVPPAQNQAAPRIPPNPELLQRDAKELADLAATIPADVNQINRGLLPKDTAEKLKRIEKLAKQLRGRITP